MTLAGDGRADPGPGTVPLTRENLVCEPFRFWLIFAWEAYMPMPGVDKIRCIVAHVRRPRLAIARSVAVGARTERNSRHDHWAPI